MAYHQHLHKAFMGALSAVEWLGGTYHCDFETATRKDAMLARKKLVSAIAEIDAHLAAKVEDAA
jgi:hypothetical protein